MAESAPRFGHESSSVSWRLVLGVVAILVVVVVVAVVALHFVLTDWAMPQHEQVVARRGTVPPAPRLQPDPRTDLAELRREKSALLSGYAWADAEHEFARIPIERAMALYAQRRSAQAREASSVAR
ncbi:MAG: hypothetical protein LT102_04390 [Burkholderiaceae bacterium]|nr:hypothetical protein [Burkholderiaceae bacterium]